MSSSSIVQALNQSIPTPEEKYATPYVEIEAAYAVHNRYLRIGLACAAGIIVLLVAIGFRLAYAIQHIEPPVVRLDPNGQATITTYASLHYQVGEPELKYFLEHFVQDYFAKVHATITDTHPRATAFLNRPMAEARKQDERVHKSIPKFLATQDDDIEIKVSIIAIKDLRKEPYEATVEFEKIFKSYPGGQETKREKHVASLTFERVEEVEDEVRRLNPLGLTVTYIRSDAAF